MDPNGLEDYIYGGASGGAVFGGGISGGYGYDANGDYIHHWEFSGGLMGGVGGADVIIIGGGRRDDMTNPLWQVDQSSSTNVFGGHMVVGEYEWEVDEKLRPTDRKGGLGLGSGFGVGFNRQITIRLNVSETLRRANRFIAEMTKKQRELVGSIIRKAGDALRGGRGTVDFDPRSDLPGWYR